MSRYSDIALIERRLQKPVVFKNAVALADWLPLSTNQLNTALFEIRSWRFIEKYHWTVPFVKKGQGFKRWKVVTGTPEELYPVLKYGLRHQLEGTTYLRRTRALFQIHLSKTDKRSTTGKVLNGLDKTLEAAVAQCEVAEALLLASGIPLDGSVEL